MTDGWAWTGSDEVAVSVSVCRWCGSRVLVLQFFFLAGVCFIFEFGLPFLAILGW